MNAFLRLLSGVSLFLYLCGSAVAFDIAIYYDARSGVNWRCQNPDSIFCRGCTEGDTSRQAALNNIGSDDEQKVFDWYAELGITHVITYYPFYSDISDLHNRSLHGMKILNASYPEEAFKYMEAQNRDLLLAGRTTRIRT